MTKTETSVIECDSSENMAVTDGQRSNSDVKLWRLCPLWQSGTSSSSTQNLQNQSNQNGVGSNVRPTNTVSSVARSLLPARRRLRLDPANNLYFPCAFPFVFSCRLLIDLIMLAVKKMNDFCLLHSISCENFLLLCSLIDCFVFGY